MKRLRTLLIVAIQFSFLLSMAQTATTISLAGTWDFSLDEQKLGEKENWAVKQLNNKITLPGTTDEAHYGEKTIGSDYGILTRAYKYVGVAWYKRELTIPKQMANKNMELYLDRVLWESKVWVDGKYCDMQDGLGVPHVHQLGKLSAGKHTITLRINNDMMHNIGDKGHSYGDYMQSIWNGAVGKIELRVKDEIHIASLKTWPNYADKKLKLTYTLVNNGKANNAALSFNVIDLSTGKTIATQTQKTTAKAGNTDASVEFTLNNDIKAWDEFTPNLYKVVASCTANKSSNSTEAEFGFRDISISKSKVLINNRPTFLRGNLDCVHFPLTGYPSCDVKEWERIFKIYKEYGLNHVRFHSWCPPTAAFQAADRLGIYLQIEILWIDWWMTSAPKDRPDMFTKGLPEGLGKNPSADAFVQAEMQRMLDAYGNHPSFAMFCIGNELGNSDFTVMQKWVDKIKQSDNRHLYAVSTARTITPVDQYSATHYIPNIGGTYGVKGYTTDYDLEQNYSKSGIPIIAHEVGQYPVYPLWSEINKYTGVLKARNLEECRASARKNKLENMDEKFHSASGALQTLLYKAHVENLFRTPSCAGFQLLSMADYQGQGEALVGWLDCFWDSKGINTADNFRKYCNSIVPLARFAKFVYKTDETFEAKIQVANYDTSTISSYVYWSITDANGAVIVQDVMDKKVIHQGKINELDKVSIPLNQITKAGKYKFSVQLVDVDINTLRDSGKYKFAFSMKGKNIHNDWDIWVYPDVTLPASDVLIATEFSDAVKARLNEGGKVLLVANKLGTEQTSRPLFFTPLFWSTVFFPGQANSTLGLYVNNAHPALANFPTDNFSHYQWEKITQGKSFVLNSFDNVSPIAQPISDFHINDKLGSIFECKVGNGKLLVCGYNIEKPENPVAKQLKLSLLTYMAQSNFNPTAEMDSRNLDSMFFYVKPIVTEVPKEFEKAIFYVKAGANIKEDGSKVWSKDLDQLLTKNTKCDYSVACTDVWKDSKGTAWTGAEMTVKIKTPKGIIGNLYVKFSDSNKQNREGSIWLEGRESKLEKHSEEGGKWVKIFVMREDTNDGEIILKTKATKGGNLMISEISLIAD